MSFLLLVSGGTNFCSICTILSSCIRSFSLSHVGNVKPIWNLVEPSRIRMITCGWFKPFSLLLFGTFRTFLDTYGTFFHMAKPCGTFPPLVEPCGTFFLSSCCQLSLKVQGRNHRSHRGPAITISKIKISNFQQPKSNAANMASLRSCNFCIFFVRFCLFVNVLCWLTRVGLMSFKCLGLDIAHPLHQ